MNPAACSCNPINLTIIDPSNPNPLIDSPAYTGYIPTRKDMISIRSIAYRVDDRLIEYQNSRAVRVILNVSKLFHV